MILVLRYCYGFLLRNTKVFKALGDPKRAMIVDMLSPVGSFVPAILWRGLRCLNPHYST